MKLIIATSNQGKLSEIRTILTEFPNLKLEICSLQNLDIPEPDEPYESFIENSKHKAKYYAEKAGCAALSEDSGLCIEALDGFPGVRTKEYVAECGGLDIAYANIEKMLAEKNNYKAAFTCAAAIYLPQQQAFICYEGKCSGKITFPARGAQGFGFDPVFIPDGYNNTFAELGKEVKNKIGHRGKALRGLLQALQNSMPSLIA